MKNFSSARKHRGNAGRCRFRGRPDNFKFQRRAVSNLQDVEESASTSRFTSEYIWRAAGRNPAAGIPRLVRSPRDFRGGAEK